MRKIKQTDLASPIHLRRYVSRLVAKTVAIIMAGLVAAVVLLSCNQHAMIYHPRPYRAEDLAGTPDRTMELSFTTSAGKQYAFYLPHRGSGSLPTRLWVAFCGNGALALDWTVFLNGYNNPDEGFLLIDYPGYGKSQGYATIESTRRAADGALNTLATTLGVDSSQLESRLCLIGHSLGSAAALDFAAHHPVERIVLIAPFTSLREEAATVVGTALSHILVENYDNRARLRELAEQPVPPRVAIVHGTDDDVIPVWMGRTLAHEFPDLVDYFEIQGGDHVSVLDVARDRVFAWMNASTQRGGYNDQRR